MSKNEKNTQRDYCEIRKFLNEQKREYQVDYPSGLTVKLEMDGVKSCSFLIRDASILECSVQWGTVVPKEDAKHFQSFVDYLNDKRFGLFLVDPENGKLSFTSAAFFQNGKLRHDQIMNCWVSVLGMMVFFGDSVDPALRGKITIVEAVKKIEDSFNSWESMYPE